MLKIVFFIIFLVPLCFMPSMFWMVQVSLFLLSFYWMCNFFSSSSYCFISYSFGVDGISFGMILLSIWISSLMMTASEKIYLKKDNHLFFMVTIIFLLLFLTLAFSSLSLFQFYLFFESSLIPTLLLILGWGYQPERLQAGNYLLFYTITVSLPMLIGIFFLYFQEFTMSFHLLKTFNFSEEILYFSLTFAFLVKMPMFLVHLWLPKAHVEAPISGSMVLAGIMLKLGGYGLIRVMPIILNLSAKYSFMWISVSLIGGVLVSLNCLRQTDIKSLIAFSSVVHMGIGLCGMMTLTEWGIKGAYVLMIGHGLCSSGLFCLANISYERLGSRSLLVNKGLMSFMPSLTFWWFLLCSSNMAAPPSLNLLGEILLINSIICWSSVTLIAIALISFFSSAYSLYLFSYSQHGSAFSSLFSFKVVSVREFLLLFLHWFPLNCLFLKSEIFLNFI